MPDAQKVLDRLRRICLSLPETSEVEAWGHPTFRVKNKIFCTFGENDTGLSLGFKATMADQQFLVQSPGYCVAAYVGKHGWVSMEVPSRPRWSLIDEHVKGSYRLIAPKKLVELL